MIIFKNLLQIRTPLVNYHVLRDGDSLTFIDSGFFLGIHYLEPALSKAGWDSTSITNLILTHGHLDHTLNVSHHQKNHIHVFAPLLDEDHIVGIHSYSGLSKCCGFLESIGRAVFSYQTPRPDTWVNESDIIPVWSGLSVIHLPGHTHGHIGLYSKTHKLLFSGDLFASYAWGTYLPPPIFNSSETILRNSVHKALSLDLDGVIPNHGDSSSPDVHLKRLKKLASRI